MVKVVIGIGIIIASFIYIMINHDKSMMENLREKGMKKLEKRELEEAQAQAAAMEAEQAMQAGQPEQLQQTEAERSQQNETAPTDDGEAERQVQQVIAGQTAALQTEQLLQAETTQTEQQM